jgi:uncharacterized protein (TIGR00297 family)
MFELLTNPVVSGLILMALLGGVSYKLHFVDISGLISAFMVGFIVWYAGGPAAFTILLFFFLSSGLATKFKYKAKAKQGLAQEAKGRRSWKNVSASGIVPTLFAIGMYLAPRLSSNPDLPFFMFAGLVGAIATTTSDNLASEIGVFSKRTPRLITNLRRKVPRGTIGAVSLLGEQVAMAAGFAIGIIVVLFAYFVPSTVPITNPNQIQFFIPLAVLTGFVGCNMDSVLGAVVQNKFVCDICGAVTDKEVHCNYQTKYVGGYKWFSNMHVNLGSSTMGATLGIVLGGGLFVWVFGGVFFWILASSSS